MNLIDVLIFGLILLGALRGYQKGLLSSIVNFLSGIAGFLIAVWKYKEALSWVQHYCPLQQWLEPIVYRAVLPAIQSKSDALEGQFLGKLLGSLPPELRSLFSSHNLSSLPLPQTIEQLGHRLAGALTERLLNLIAFGVVFYTVVVLIQLLVAIVLRPFGNWSGSLNRGGGLVFGGLSSLLGLSVLAGLFFPLLHLGVGGSFNALIQNSTFYPYLVEIFDVLDRVLSAQLRQNLLEPLSVEKGNWF